MNKFSENFALEWKELLPYLQDGVRILLILVMAWIVLGLARRAIRLFRARMSARAADVEELKRIETLSRAFRYLVSVVVWVVAGMLILSALGISIAPILATAGVAGIAIGFAAQSLVKDYFTGFIMLTENQVRVGDVVNVAGIGGLVEEVTLRYVRLRDYNGNVHFVPNGAISTVTNMSREFAQAVIDIGVAYRENVDEVFEVMREVAKAMRGDSIFGPKILEDLEIAGVENWADSAVVIRCRFKVAPLEQWTVRREYLRRLKRAFDERGIEIPYPHLTVYAGQDKQGRAPAFPLRCLDRAEPQPTGASASDQ
ncbi:mechanosensitive ion channel family protein [Pelomicrobium sp.]|jgi:small-conductance mechanosensitive channel|uniref:mechanosensitive ion channel family protein n=1 Tax=Pelomicrobium sp. TaxID=2815319 RepID=UPI002FDD3AA3